jgi:hypothetical protein
MKAIAVAFLLSAIFAVGTEPPLERVTLKLPSAVQSQNVQIVYFLGGGFGGYGDRIQPKRNVDSYSIETTHQGQPVTEIKVVVFIPSCEFQTFEWTRNTKGSSQKILTCKPLPEVTVEGSVDRIVGKSDTTLTIWYIADWMNEYFGIKDGMVPQLEIAKPLLDAKGRFRVEVPDFSKDSLGSKGNLMFVGQSGNVTTTKELKIEQTYPYVVVTKD